LICTVEIAEHSTDEEYEEQEDHELRSVLPPPPVNVAMFRANASSGAPSVLVPSKRALNPGLGLGTQPRFGTTTVPRPPVVPDALQKADIAIRDCARAMEDGARAARHAQQLSSSAANAFATEASRIERSLESLREAHRRLR
jgi:hypothetical protein